jgi:hypothetical protein
MFELEAFRQGQGDDGYLLALLIRFLATRAIRRIVETTAKIFQGRILISF